MILLFAKRFHIDDRALDAQHRFRIASTKRCELCHVGIERPVGLTHGNGRIRGALRRMLPCRKLGADFGEHIGERVHALRAHGETARCMMPAPFLEHMLGARKKFHD